VLDFRVGLLQTEFRPDAVGEEHGPRRPARQLPTAISTWLPGRARCGVKKVKAWSYGLLRRIPGANGRLAKTRSTLRISRTILQPDGAWTTRGLTYGFTRPRTSAGPTVHGNRRCTMVIALSQLEKTAARAAPLQSTRPGQGPWDAEVAHPSLDWKERRQKVRPCGTCWPGR